VQEELEDRPAGSILPVASENSIGINFAALPVAWQPACPVCLKPHSSKALNSIILAGLLTYSFFETPFPFLVGTVVLSIVQRIKRSLQQRVCSGFSPDSLFSASPERKRTPPKLGCEGRELFYMGKKTGACHQGKRVFEKSWKVTLLMSSHKFTGMMLRWNT
jgi:hypothetical protein